MTPAPAAGDEPRPSVVDPEALVASALGVLEAATTMAALEEAQTDLLGKRSPLRARTRRWPPSIPGNAPKPGGVSTRRAGTSSPTWRNGAPSSSAQRAPFAWMRTDWT